MSSTAEKRRRKAHLAALARMAPAVAQNEIIDLTGDDVVMNCNRNETAAFESENTNATSRGASQKENLLQDSTIVNNPYGKKRKLNHQKVAKLSAPREKLILNDDNVVVTTNATTMIRSLAPSPTISTIFCNKQNNIIFQLQQQKQQQSPSDETNKKVSLFHIKQKDGWSCGFRNWQMLLSALIPHLDKSTHPYFTVFTQEKSENITYIPTLEQLQCTLEESWLHGFDPLGAQHYKGQLKRVGDKKEQGSKIGAIEVLNTMTFGYIDATVVQFIRCAPSRELLVPFCQAYFRKQTNALCALCNKNASSMTIAQNILQRVEDKMTTSNKAHCCDCTCDVLPLFLQWEGHSVTVVGIECMNDTGCTTNLIVLDPGRAVPGPTKPQRQAKNNSNSLVPPFLRLPHKRLQEKDIQILLVTPRILTMVEQMERKRKASVTTACKNLVSQLL